ncbi:hypothetical protein B0A55_11405 [Friedmanniomyces simplex]|uniref:3'-5' exonuclease domain-containing protein n=1 Tax=Friedmanniomyces simplex TaxID=329884 RepID=A0A4U0WJR0_9PEZI|nr:hypothetical protein B0A55_11405 [Friedmanniomyces simplex]
MPATTARLHLGRQCQAGETRAYTMPAVSMNSMSISEDIPPTSASTSTAEDATRLPSTRPLDYRWDRSRGIIFANARRSQDLTWTPSRGVTFSTPQTQSRSYAARALGSSAPPSRSASPAKQPEKDSLYDNPHRTPVRLPSQNDTIAALQKEVSELKAQGEAEREAEREAQSAKLMAEERAKADMRAGLLARIALLEQERRNNPDLAERRIGELEKSIADERTNAQLRMHAAMSQLQQSSTATARKAANLEQYVKQLQQEKEQSDEEHAGKLAGERQALQRQHNDEVQRLTRERKLRESERQTYLRYRKVWLELRDSLALFNRPIRDIEDIFSRATKRAEALPSYSSRIDQINPLLRRTQAKLFERLDASLRESADRARDSEQAITSLRLEQREVVDVLNGVSHDSRAITLSLRLSNPTRASAVELAYYVANDKPFRARLDRLDTDIAQLKHRIESERSQMAAKRYTAELEGLQEARKVVKKLISAHILLRDTEAHRALLTDHIAAKEVFASTEISRGMLQEAVKAWGSLVEDEHTAARIGQKDRTIYKDSRDQVRDKLRAIEGLIRKRVVLQQQLGQIPAGREEELDAIIRERLTLVRVAERTAIDKLTISGHARSFARSLPAPPSRTFDMSKSSDVGYEAPAQPRTRLERRRSIPLRAQSLPTVTSLSRSRHSDVAPLLEKLKVRLRTLQPGPERSTAFQEGRASKSALQPPDREKKRTEFLRASPVDQANSRVVDANLRTPKKTVADQPRPRVKATNRRHSLGGGTGPVVRSRPFKTITRIPTKGSRSPVLHFRPSASLQAPFAFPSSGLRGFHGARELRGGVAPETDTSDQSYPPHDPFLTAAAGSNEQGDMGHRAARVSTGMHAVPHGEISMETNVRQQYLSVTREQMPSSDRDTKSDSIETPTSSANPPLSSSSVGMSVSAGSVTSADINQGQPPHDDSLPTVTYRIPSADYRDAIKASPNTNAAYWSYRMYRNAAGDTPTVHYCTKLDQAERVLQQHFFGQPVLGFDIEWEFKATKKASAKQNVSLIQIACEDRICLIHVANFMGTEIEQLVPSTLREILESDQVVKAGVNIGGDARRMREYLGVDMRAQFELSYLFKVVTFSRKDINRSMKGAGLAAQVQSVLLLPLLKGDVRVSSWSRKLSKEQTDYSASDAYAGFQLFHALEAKRVMMNPMPPRPAFRELELPLVLGDGTILRPSARKRPPAPVAAEEEGKAADEVDDEAEDVYFDAMETQDVYQLEGDAKMGAGSSSGGGVEYPALPSFATDTATVPEVRPPSTMSIRNAMTPNAIPNNVNPDNLALAPSTPSSQSAEIHAANLWLTAFKHSHPATQAKDPSLLAYHLWHHQRHSLAHTATLLSAAKEQPPLAQTTVASLILEALRCEVVLDVEGEGERVRGMLEVLPRGVWGRYGGVVGRCGWDIGGWL